MFFFTCEGKEDFHSGEGPGVQNLSLSLDMVVPRIFRQGVKKSDCILLQVVYTCIYVHVVQWCERIIQQYKYKSTIRVQFCVRPYLTARSKKVKVCLLGYSDQMAAIFYHLTNTEV